MAKKKTTPRKTKSVRSKAVSRRKRTTKKTLRKKTVTKKASSKASKGKKTPPKKTAKKKVTKKKVAKKKVTKVRSSVKSAEAPAKSANGKAKLKQGNRRRRKKVVSVSALRGYDKYIPVAAQVSRNGNGEDELSLNQLRRIKSDLTRKDINRYRRQLLRKRADLLSDVKSLEVDAKKQEGEGISYEHMADAGSDNFEQEFTLGLVEEERKLLNRINAALERITEGAYGICVVTGTPIGAQRLNAKPWAKYCIEIAREKDRLGQL